MACLRATSVGVSPGPKLSATISRFWSSVHVRRRSLRVITSTRRAACALMTYLMSGLSVRAGRNRRFVHDRLPSQHGPVPLCVVATSLTDRGPIVVFESGLGTDSSA